MFTVVFFVCLITKKVILKVSDCPKGLLLLYREESYSTCSNKVYVKVKMMKIPRNLLLI